MNNKTYTNGIVYIIVNRTNLKFYAGSSIKYQYRVYEHKRMLRNGNHHSIKLQNAVNKYGIENFEFYVVEQHKNISIHDLRKCEQSWIDISDYNIAKTVNFFQEPWSDERREKRKEQSKKYWTTERRLEMRAKQLGENNSNFGHKWSKNQRLAMSKRQSSPDAYHWMADPIAREKADFSKFGNNKKGKDNYRFSGYYIICFDKFETPNTDGVLDLTDMNSATINRWCKNPDKVLSPKAIANSRCKYITKTMIGKTPRELGFWFESIQG